MYKLEMYCLRRSVMVKVDVLITAAKFKVDLYLFKALSLW